MQSCLRGWLCVVMAGMAFGCASGTEERLSSLESRMGEQQVLDLRLSHVENKLTQIEQDLGTIRADMASGSKKKGKPQPRKVEPRRVEPLPAQAALAGQQTAHAEAAADSSRPTVSGAPAQQEQPQDAAVALALHDLTASPSPNSAPSDTAGTDTLPSQPASEVPQRNMAHENTLNTVPAKGGQAATALPVSPSTSINATTATAENAATPPKEPGKDGGVVVQPKQTTSAKDGSSSPTGKGKHNQGKAQYDAALRAFEQKKMSQALEGFSSFVHNFPDSSLTPNALYWIGECHYSTGQYATAVVDFKKVVSAYPKHPKAAAALLKTGYAYAKLKDNENARFYLEILLEDFPNSQPATLARQRLAQLK